MDAKHIILFLFLITSFAFFRYTSTYSPPFEKGEMVSLIGQISGQADSDGNFSKYPFQVTHQTSLKPHLSNLHHVTNLKVKTKQQLRYGDIIHLTGFLSPYYTITNPRINLIDQKPNPFIQKTLQLRKHIEQRIYALLPHDHATLALGMLVGTSVDFTPAVQDALRKTGTIHMVVVSGFNITIVAAIALSVAGHIHRRYAIYFTFAMIVWFVCLTGMQPPTVRAALMISIVLLAQSFGRLVASRWALALSVLAFTIYQPQIVHNISFQLSVAATIGIIELADPLSKLRLFSRLPIRQELATTLAAQLAVTPLILHYFGALSLLSPLANIAVSWTIPFIMSATSLLIIASILLPFSAEAIKFTLIPFTAFFTQTVTWIGSFEFAYLQDIKVSWQISILIYVILAILIVITKSKNMYSILSSSKIPEKGIITQV